MHQNISINTLCLSPAPFGELTETVARIGAGAICPDVGQLQEHGAAAAGQAIRDAGLVVSALTHRAFGFASPAEIAPARERLERTLDIAQAIGAPTLVMTSGGRGNLTWSEAAARFAEAITPCADLARSAGVRLTIEPTSHLYADASIVHRLSDCLHIARQAGIAVTMDLFACWVDADIEAAIAAAAPHTALVQVSDHVPGDRGLPCRAVPGDGAIPLERLLPAIVQHGFNGWFDLEVIGPRLQAEGEQAGLVRAAANVGRILESAGLEAA